MRGEWTQCLNQERYPEVSDLHVPCCLIKMGY